ncbi:MORN_motif [Hexamita inflata]|uniref:MORN motif n=1 Tax=Hexamita inflata TaxID=28002 RepID=A0AA86NA93_9EUKA|nr:MORN motif [Hexamita inflata]
MDGAHSSLTTIVTPTYTFTGDVRSNKMCGFGTQHFSDGTVYVGEFKEDKYDGKGSFWDGKDTFQGVFKEGKLKQLNANYVDQQAILEFNEMLEQKLGKKEVDKFYKIVGKNERIDGKLTEDRHIKINLYEVEQCMQNNEPECKLQIKNAQPAALWYNTTIEQLIAKCEELQKETEILKTDYRNIKDELSQNIKKQSIINSKNLNTPSQQQSEGSKCNIVQPAGWCYIQYPNGNTLKGQLNNNILTDLRLHFANRDGLKLSTTASINLNNDFLTKINNEELQMNLLSEEEQKTALKLLHKNQVSENICEISFPNGNVLRGEVKKQKVKNAVLTFTNGDVIPIIGEINIEQELIQRVNSNTFLDVELIKDEIKNDTEIKYIIYKDQNGEVVNEQQATNQTNENRQDQIDQKAEILDKTQDSADNTCLIAFSNGKSIKGQLQQNNIVNLTITSENGEQIPLQQSIEIQSELFNLLNQNDTLDLSKLSKEQRFTYSNNEQKQLQQTVLLQEELIKILTKDKKMVDLSCYAPNSPEYQIDHIESEIYRIKQNVKVNDKSDEKVIKDEKEQQKAPQNQQMGQNSCQKAANEYNDDNLAQDNENQVTTTKSEQTLSCARNKATNAIQQQEQSAETGKQQVPIQNTPLKETDSNLNTQPKHCAQDPQVNKEEIVDVQKKCKITYNGNSVQGIINGNTIEDLQILFKNGDKAKLKDVIYISAAVLNILNQKDKFNKSDFSKDINNKVHICDQQFSSVNNCSVLYPNGNILTGQLEKGILSNPILHFKNDDAVKIQEQITIKCTTLFKLLLKESFDSGLLNEVEFKRVSQIEIKGDTSSNQCDQVNSQIAAQAPKPEQDKQDSQQQASIQQKVAADNSNQCDIQAKQLQINKDNFSNQPQTGDTKTNQTIQSKQEIYLPALIPNTFEKQKETQDECQTQIDLNAKEEQKNQNEILKTDNEQNNKSAQKKLEEKVKINKTAENGQFRETQMNVPVKTEPVKDLKEEKESIEEQKGTKVQQQVHEGKLTNPTLNEEDESSSSIQIDISSSDE